MDKAKQKALEEAGFRIGTVQEFLGLTDEENRIANNTPERLVVISLMGEAETGKDSIANALAALHGFQEVGLADGIRESLDGLDARTWAYRKERQKAGKTDRWAQQITGTECRDDLGCEFLWLEVLAVKIRYAHHYHPRPRTRFVVPDLRHPHEHQYLADTIAGWGGLYENWKVTRPGHGKIAENAHSSENSFGSIPFDRWLVNEGDLAGLASKASSALDRTLGRAASA